MLVTNMIKKLSNSVETKYITANQMVAPDSHCHFWCVA